jgi:hypothetical protein
MRHQVIHSRFDFFGLNHYTTQLVAKPAMTSGGTASVHVVEG